MLEIVSAFISCWKLDNQDVRIRELIEAWIAETRSMLRQDPPAS